MIFSKISLSFLLGTAAVVSAECSREALISTRDNFFKSAAAKADVAKLSPAAKIALNNKITPLAQTPYANLTGFTQLLVQAVDTETCDIATFRVSDSQVLSTRLRIDKTSSSVTEIEFLQAVAGDQFFRPAGFPATNPALFDQKQTPVVPPFIPASFAESNAPAIPKADIDTTKCKASNETARLLTRKELVYVATTYTDGFRGEPWNSCVQGGSSCPRNENGVTTTFNCALGLPMFGFDVKGRRWVADVETGVVLGQFYFGYLEGGFTSLGNLLPAQLFLHEYFKVDKGKLAYIFAPMKNIPKDQASATVFA
jgi:hypothetical protein